MVHGRSGNRPGSRDRPPARERLTIFLGGSEEVPGLSFYGLTTHAVKAHVPQFPRGRWPMCPAPEATLLQGEDWRVAGWDLHVASWPTGDGFRDAIRATLQVLINVGSRIAWVGAEGIPFCDPPGLFDPACMTGGVLAWLSREGAFGCPLDPDQPLTAASDEEMLQLRDRAGWLATTGEGDSGQ